MSTALDDLRFEVAFSADPDTVTPAFTDLTSRTILTRSGVMITRGRQDEFTANAPGRCTLTFDNTDGKLTPGHASAYANLQVQNRLRVTYRDQAVNGNLLSAQNASFETSGNVGDWVPGGSVPPTLSNSTTHPQSGSRGMLITWGTGGSFPQAQVTVTTVIGRTYTASAYVWVPVGSPNVRLAVAGSGVGTASSVNGAQQRISLTWVATVGASSLQVWPETSPTSGQQAWVDAVQVDEGSSVRTFTTAAPPIKYRFDGYVDGWPTEWPGGGDEESTATVTAYDLQSRITRGRKLGSVIEETWRLNEPGWHFPLNEPSDSTSAGDIIGTGKSLAVTLRGTGAGELTFGEATGPPTDGGTAMALTPTSAANGKYLSGEVAQLDFFATGITFEATFLTTVTGGNDQTIMRAREYFGTYMELRITNAGNARLIYSDQWYGTATATTGGTNYADGRTHTIRGSVENTSGLTKTLRLRVDGGTQVSTTVETTMWVPALSQFLEVGGTLKEATLFTGTIAHVAAFPTVLDATTSTEHHAAVSTGFAGETSDARIERIASWVGLPAAVLDLDAGQQGIGHVPSNGRDPWEYMQAVSDTEGGNLYVSGSGQIVMRNRAYQYDDTAAVVATLAADDIGPDTNLVHNLADVYNDVTVSREGGATTHVRDVTSVGRYGTFATSQTSVADSDLAAFDRAHWLLTQRAEPVTRLTELILDGLTGSTAASVRAVDLDSRISVTGMPTQSPVSSFDLRAQGYTEQISDAGWTVTVNTTPFQILQVLELDDSTRGLLDSVNRLAY